MNTFHDQVAEVSDMWRLRIFNSFQYLWSRRNYKYSIHTNTLRLLSVPSTISIADLFGRSHEPIASFACKLTSCSVEILCSMTRSGTSGMPVLWCGVRLALLLIFYQMVMLFALIIISYCKHKTIYLRSLIYLVPVDSHLGTGTENCPIS